MFWTVEKLEDRIRWMEPYRYRDAMPLTSMRWLEDGDKRNGVYPPDLDAAEPAELGTTWRGRDRYIWLEAAVQIPQQWADRTILGRFDFGQTGGGGNSGFESMLYMNGKPYQGVDSNHREVFLPADLAGQTARLTFRLWSGLGGYDIHRINEHGLRLAEICWLDEAADDLYFTARAALDTVKVLPDTAAERHDLLAALDRAFAEVDWSQPGSQPFYRSVQGANEVLQQRLSLLPKHSGVKVTCIGHTHIDVAWLWRLTHTREKAARSFSTVLRLMERYPEYMFLQTMPQLYDYVQQDYPELYEQIRHRVREGRWEAGGAMWLEADCNLTSGESLVRQLLYGIRYFQRQFGVTCTYLWLPDVFGYSWALPQILRKCGIQAFMTTKISWNQYNRMPHDTFNWRGIDGTEILAHFITTPDPGGSEGSFYYTYNGVITPTTVQGIWKAYRDKGLNKNLLLAYGHGDGGGGVTRDMLEMRRRLERMPGLPEVATGRADDYFEKLKETVEHSGEYVHTWDGELYLELHRGTYTSQAWIKRANRRMELLYREAEWLNVVRSLQEAWQAYPARSLEEGWKIVLRNQFHDIIPGSSIREVYEDSREEYAQAEQIGRSAWQEAADRIPGLLAKPQEPREPRPHDHAAVMVYNSAPYRRTDLVTLTDAVPAAGHPGGVWRDGAGQPLAAQRTAQGWVLRVEDVPSLGAAPILYVEEAGSAGERQADAEPTPFVFAADGIDTPYYRLEWSRSGQLTRIFDKQASREVMPSGSRGNVFQIFEDKPKSRHEAWDIDLFYQQKMETVDACASIRLLENGPLLAVVEFKWSYRNSAISQRMTVYAHTRRIDFNTTVDWHERRKLLKVAFPVLVRSTEAVYDIQFGNVKRPTHWNTSWDYAKFETVGHQWADLSERGYGVSLLNDSKYGYDIKDNVMRLTLVKSALVPDDTADQGAHEFLYALLPHAGDWLAAGTVQEAWSVNQALTCGPGAPGAAPFSLFSLSDEDAARVWIDAVKKSEDGDRAVLRLHEFAGQRGGITIASDWPIAGWQECDLLERAEPDGARGSGEIRLDLAPFEIKTVLVQFTAGYRHGCDSSACGCGSHMDR